MGINHLFALLVAIRLRRVLDRYGAAVIVVVVLHLEVKVPVFSTSGVYPSETRESAGRWSRSRRVPWVVWGGAAGEVFRQAASLFRPTT